MARLPTQVHSKFHKADVAARTTTYETVFRFANILTRDNDETEKTAQFYKDVFGFKEFRRCVWPVERLEILLDQGETVDDSLYNFASKRLIVVTGRGDVPSKSARVGLLVTDIKAAFASAVAWGAPVTRELKMGGTTGMYHTALLADPSGNLVELIEPVTPDSWRN